MCILRFTIRLVESNEGEIGNAASEMLVEQEEEGASSEDNQVEYGVDVSFPIHNVHISENHAVKQFFDSTDLLSNDQDDLKIVQPLGDRQIFYETFLQGCRDFHYTNGKLCDNAEEERLTNNRDQPQTMMVCLYVLCTLLVVERINYIIWMII